MTEIKQPIRKLS